MPPRKPSPLDDNYLAPPTESDHKDFQTEIQALDAIEGGKLFGVSELLQMTLAIQGCQSFEELAEVTTSRLSSMICPVAVKWVELGSDPHEVIWSYPQLSENSNQEKTNLCEAAQENEPWNINTIGTQFYSLIVRNINEQSDVSYLKKKMLLSELKGNSCYWDYMVERDVDEIIAVQVTNPDPTGARVILAVELRECESIESIVIMLSIIRDHVKVACSNIMRTASLANLSKSFNELYRSEDDVGITIVGRDGIVITDYDKVSERAISGLGGYVDGKGDLIVPQRVSDWISNEIHHKARLSAAKESINRTFTALNGETVCLSLFIERIGQGAIIITKAIPGLAHEEGIACYKLSGRELEVLRILCAGKLSQEIADTLSISKRTIDKHLERIYKKLSVKNRHEAIDKVTHLVDSFEPS